MRKYIATTSLLEMTDVTDRKIPGLMFQFCRSALESVYSDKVRCSRKYIQTEYSDSSDHSITDKTHQVSGYVI